MNEEITLNHTIIPSLDNVEAAKFYAHIFGFDFIKEWGHFAVVKASSTLTLDFVTAEEKISSHHYAFKVSDRQFDEIFGRLKIKEVVFGSGPDSQDDGEINRLYGGRGVYFKDPSGHVLEILTADYVID
ncbi:MAG: VOC family protein [Verrucomicrobiota bacterium]